MVAKAEARVLNTVMMSVSAAIALVALSYAAYALFATRLSPAASAACTALGFAVLTFVFGLAGPAIIRARSKASHDEAELAAHSSRMARLSSIAEVAAIVVGVGLKAAMIQRHKRGK